VREKLILATETKKSRGRSSRVFFEFMPNISFGISFQLMNDRGLIEKGTQMNVQHMSERRHAAQFFDKAEGRELRSLGIKPRRVGRNVRSSDSGLPSEYDDKPRARKGRSWKVHHRTNQFH
jgi:hypothetical protein